MKKLHGFSFSINMANFEGFWGVKNRGGSSLYPTRPARLDSTTESGPGSTRPAREAKMLRLNRLEASLFRLQLGRFSMKNDCISFYSK